MKLKEASTIEHHFFTSGRLGDASGFLITKTCTPHHLSDFLKRFVGYRFVTCLNLIIDAKNKIASGYMIF